MSEVGVSKRTHQHFQGVITKINSLEPSYKTLKNIYNKIMPDNLI